MSKHSNRAAGSVTAKIKLLFDPGVVPLNQAIELEERPPSKSMTQLIYAICGIVLLGILWSALARVEIVATARGRIVPAGELVAVQHLEGGVIADILIAEGDRVKKGQALLRLAELDTRGRLEQLQAKRATHLLAIEGDQAIFNGVVPDFERVVDGFAAQKAELMALYNARLQTNASQLTVLSAQHAQRQSEVDRLRSQLVVLRRDEKLSEEELAMRSDLLERRLTTRERHYSAQRDVADRQKLRMNARDQLAGAESELVEFARKLEEAQAKIRAEAQEAIARNTGELSEVEAALRNEEGRAGRLSLVAPIDGVVSSLSVKAVNAVIKPGETVLELVPTADPLMVIADVNPQDIGQLALGQRADIRVSAFDYSMYGTLEGSVERISATTFADGEGRQFYKVRVRPVRDYLGHDRKAARVLPGMEVEVDIKTGSRSILAYVLKPVTRTWDTALHEP